jgi:hypothetical protein
MAPGSMHKLSHVLLGGVFLALLYSILSLLNTVNFGQPALVLMVLAGAFALGVLALSLFVDFKAKPDIAVMSAAIAVSFGAGTFVLHLTGRDLLDILDAKVQQLSPLQAPPQAENALTGHMTTWESARSPDKRQPAEIYEVLQKQGYTFSPFFNPHSMMEVIDAKIVPPPYPLGSPSYKYGGKYSITLGCSEGDLRDFPIIRKDRYGFNNDDTVYAYNNPYMLVGGSFFMGSCFHQEDTVQAIMRRNGYPTVSTGFGGSGALAAIAILKEYGETFRPPAVFLQFYDPNDIEVLKNRELRSAFLLQYLRDGFTQHLIDRQPELDALWAKGHWNAAVNKFYNDPELKASWERKLDINLPLVQELLGHDIKSLTEDDDLLLIFERILETAKRRLAAWGGRIYLVMIPNEGIYTMGTIPKYTRRVMSIMSKLGITVIDVDQALRAAGGPLQFHADPKGWSHLNAGGYLVMARQMMQQVDHDFPASGPNSSGVE